MYSQVIDDSFITQQWIDKYVAANKDIFSFKIIKPEIVPWVESNLYLPRTSSDYAGPFSYDMTPYWKEPIGHAHPNSTVRTVTIMKCVQSGCTESVIIPIICYTMSEDPCSILFTAADLTQAKDTVEKRLDPVLLESQLTHLLRPHVVKKSNSRSGDTGSTKEFIGGSFYAKGTQTAAAFRQFPAKRALNDDWDNAPQNVGKEGSARALVEGRQNSYGDRAFALYVSTPTITQTSLIYNQFLLGTQKKWQWPCHSCGAMMALEFKIERADGGIAGLVYTLDGKGRLNPNSVAYMCPHCANLTHEKNKYELNHNGLWVPGTDSPVELNHESYHFTGLALPSGFTSWVKIVEKFINAGGNSASLLSWNNLYLGLPFAEMGDTPKVNALMENVRAYHPGVVPDTTITGDNNGQIIMMTLACDINGVMNKGDEDVRLDWEVLVHTTTGVTYSVDHGSIGTRQRIVHRSKLETEKELNRVKWTLTPGFKYSVWPELTKLIKKQWPLESEITAGLWEEILDAEGKNAGWKLKATAEELSTETKGIAVTISVIDSGFGEKMAMQYVETMQKEGLFIYGVKGRPEEQRKLVKDTNPIKRSIEHPKTLYILEVNQLKDILAGNMKQQAGEDGSQPAGFMNYPQPRDDKYNYKTFFSQYEGEVREEVKDKIGQPAGFVWKKRNGDVQNHFWDVRVYGLAAPLIYLDGFKRSNTDYKNYTWEDFVTWYLS